MSENMRIPPISMAEVFVDGHCVGFLSDVKLSREDDGGYNLEGEWSGYSDVLEKDSLFTISVPRFEFKFLADKVDVGVTTSSGRISFKSASYLPDGPNQWLNKPGEE
jgi:hypothetical protein